MADIFFHKILSANCCSIAEILSIYSSNSKEKKSQCGIKKFKFWNTLFFSKIYYLYAYDIIFPMTKFEDPDKD